ncbi:hypothetical protein [Nocardia goodfellowii]|uniref:Cytochrome P450 n=1 Tax=Nocardia goodfellowii TaxID=882446 RepID=A0ABS4QP46_9NOCA|nr:hypothetical protein [Nocardia goodfellowii]MBP2193486.1 hypothetical protein [Nocardia goodfellowii]
MDPTLPLITDPERAREVLTHCPMPPVRPDAASGIAWLRAQVPRFSNGAEHRRRHALVLAELDRLDPSALRIAARTAEGPLAHVQVLADALGLRGVSVAAVEVVAAHYQPHIPPTPEADAAVAELVAACGGVADETTAARISLLVQACPATAALLANVRTVRADIAEHGWATKALESALAQRPPVPRTRRVVDGNLVDIDLTRDGLSFGAGPHMCPGRAHALAIAAGILEAAPPRIFDPAGPVVPGAPSETKR